MNANNETWKDQDSDQNDHSNSNSFSVQGKQAYSGRDLNNDDDDLDEEDTDYNVSNAYNDEPDETPEQGETRKEGSGYHTQSEVDQPNRSADTSFSEQTDVTPPNKHEFPSVGPAKTDFESRPQGRTTGRMVGHEPGTEGI